MKVKKVLSWGFVIAAGIFITITLVSQHIENEKHNKRIREQKIEQAKKLEAYYQTPEGQVAKKEADEREKKEVIRASAHKYFGISKDNKSGLRGFKFADGVCEIDFRFYPLGLLKYKEELGTVLAPDIKSMYEKHSEIKNFIVKIESPFQDSYGKVTWKAVGSFEFSRAIYNRIRWENFNNGEMFKVVRNIKGFRV